MNKRYNSLYMGNYQPPAPGIIIIMIIQQEIKAQYLQNISQFFSQLYIHYSQVQKAQYNI